MRNVLVVVVALIVITYFFPGLPLHPILHQGLLLLSAGAVKLATVI